MKKLGGIVALIAGVSGAIAAGLTLFAGGVWTTFNADRADTVIGFGWGGIVFSFLTIVLGAVAMGAKGRVPGVLLILCAFGGAIFGGPLVMVFMAFARGRRRSSLGGRTKAVPGRAVASSSVTTLTPSSTLCESAEGLLDGRKTMTVVSQRAASSDESVRAMEALGFSEERARFFVTTVYAPGLDSEEVVRRAIRASMEGGAIMKNDDQKTTETPTIPELLAAMEQRLTERLDRLEQRLGRQGELLVAHTGLLTQIWKHLEIPEDDEAFQEVGRLQVAGDD